MRWQNIDTNRTHHEVGDVRIEVERLDDNIKSAVLTVDNVPLLKITPTFDSLNLSEPAPPATRTVHVLHGSIGTLGIKEVFAERSDAQAALDAHKAEFGEKADGLKITEAEERVPEGQA